MRYPLASALCSAFLLVGVVAGPASASDSRSKRDQNKAQLQQLKGQLNLTLASDSRVEAEVNRLTALARAQQARADAARQAQEAVAGQITQTTQHLGEVEAHRVALRQQVVIAAISAYVDPQNQATPAGPVADDLAETARQQVLLSVVQGSATDSLDLLKASGVDLNAAKDDLDRLHGIASRRAKLEQDLARQLRLAQAAQQKAHAELQHRVDDLQQETKALSAQEGELEALIQREDAAAAAAIAARRAQVGAPGGRGAPGRVSGVVSNVGLIWPLHGPVTSEFGPRWGGFHPGIDIAPSYGTPIGAAKDGVVIQAGPYGGYGNFVLIAHGDNIVTGYAHQSRIAVSQGQQVNQGEIIGYVGSTGFSTGPHLHFEVRINGSPQNPRNYESGSP